MQKLIGLNLLPDEDFRLRVIHGVLDYVRRQPSLKLAVRAGVPYLPFDEMQDSNVDGIIAMAHSIRAARRLKRLKRPVVVISSQSQQSEFASVATDDSATGRLAAKHLLDRGLKRIACVYHPRWANDVERLNSLRLELEEVGVSVIPVTVQFCRTVKDLELERPEVDEEKLAKALGRLPRPLGVFATHDEFAAAAAQALRSVGASLPYDAAILGTGNNHLICESCDTPLSSIVQPGAQIGFEAAAALHRLVQGEELGEQHIRLSPVEIAVRRSTDVLATRDDMVVEAIEQIRLRSNEPFSVEDLAELMCVSRSGLYKRFIEALGHTPTEEIRRARMARAEHLLASTSMQIPFVAYDCGYRSVGAFCRAFRLATGVTPIGYRKKTRAASNGV